MSADHPSTHTVHRLYSDHHGWLHAWLQRRLGCAQQAADLAHDTFLRILAARDALALVREPRAYLTTTAKRLLIDRSRRQTIERAYLAELAATVEAAGADYPPPEQILVAIEALEQIAAVLEQVAPRPREAFLLHYLDGLTHGEVGARLGVSARMVRKYLVQVLLCAEALA